jgi:hypothetical protein
MQEQPALHINAELAFATLKCRSSWFYTVMQEQPALTCNAKLAGATH